MAQNLFQNTEATLFIRDLNEKVTEEILYELFLQVGHVVHVNIPKDRIQNRSNGYGFVEFADPAEAQYAIQVLSDVRLYGHRLLMNISSGGSSAEVDIGAKLYVSNLASDITDLDLMEYFRSVVEPKQARVVVDPDTGNSRNCGFVTFNSFDDADLAIKTFNGQMFRNQVITVKYSQKADGKKGELHGDKAERIVAPQVVK